MNRRAFLASGSTAIATAILAKNPPRKLRVGVIGHTGRGNYGHGLDTVWLKVPETEIVAVADAHDGGLANAKKKLQVTEGFANYRTMLRKVKPDIVAVCPRHADHLEAMREVRGSSVRAVRRSTHQG